MPRPILCGDDPVQPRRLGAALRPGAHIIDTYPFLQYIPGFTTQLRQGHQEELELFRGEVAKVKAKLVPLSP